MLITETNITVKAGDGGNGRLSFRKNKKGPDGGNGGKGGDIYLVPTNNPYILSKYHSLSKIEAANGERGGKNTKTGKSANDLDFAVPIGTTVTDQDTGETFEISTPDDRTLLCEGGIGGRGNWEFRSSTNTTPEYAENGEKGQIRHLHINYRLIADIGLIGLPNAGKSSLLEALTSARPKIGDYPFTTLEPNLGSLNNKIIADIPGLIEGASSGKGLGIRFLKHIEKVSLLVHCISGESKDPVKDYTVVRNELATYNKELLDKKELILLTKTDTISPSQEKSSIKKLQKISNDITAASIYDDDSLSSLIKIL